MSRLRIVAGDTAAVGTDADNYAADLSALGIAAANLAADTSAALTDPPPRCVPGLTGDYGQAMRELSGGAALFARSVSGQHNVGISAATAEVDHGNGYLGKAAGDFTNYEAG